MAISADDVRKVARLARLRLTDEEVVTFARQLDGILAHFAALREVDTEGVEATSHAVPIDCPMRPDQPVPGLSRQEALRNAPRAEEGLFVVPKILG